jgi:hypothetical protein
VGVVNPTEVSPAVMRALYRLCVAMPKGFAATIPEFVTLLAPQTAVKDGADPQLTALLSVREAVLIGLLEESQKSQYSLALPAPPKKATIEESDAFLVRHLRRLVLSEKNNKPLFAQSEGEEDDVEDSTAPPLDTSLSREFTRIQCWLLLQNPTRPPLEWAASDERRNVQLIQRGYAGRDLVRNGNRWTNFRRWSQFLGLSRQDGKGTGVGVVPDPTLAVIDEFKALELGKGELSLIDLREQLAETLPVLDGGRYRQEVLQYVEVSESADVASPSLALALLRLRSAGIITLDRRADFRGGSLVVGDQPFTHAIGKRAS